MSETKRLVLLGCTQKKRPDIGELSAQDRYDGPLFRVLRKFNRENYARAAELDVYILSAKFGLIPGDRLIPDYNYVMTSIRALELRTQTLVAFKQILQKSSYDELFISLGQQYMSAFHGYQDIIPSGIQIFTSHGSLGRRQVELQQWLNRFVSNNAEGSANEHSNNVNVCPTAMPQGTVSLRGVEVCLESTQIYEVARHLLATEPIGAASYQSWYVEIDDKRVSPKWLVSKLTGLRVASFHSGEARRLLMQLGVEVKRT